MWTSICKNDFLTAQSASGYRKYPALCWRVPHRLPRQTTDHKWGSLPAITAGLRFDRSQQPPTLRPARHRIACSLTYYKQTAPLFNADWPPHTGILIRCWEARVLGSSVVWTFPFENDWLHWVYDFRVAIFMEVRAFRLNLYMEATTFTRVLI